MFFSHLYSHVHLYLKALEITVIRTIDRWLESKELVFQCQVALGFNLLVLLFLKSYEFGLEGNGTPLQYSCLEHPMDGGAWWAAVHGVTEGQTRLSDFTFTFHFMHWRGKWQPILAFLPGESQGWWSLVGCHLWGRTESDTTEVTQLSLAQLLNFSET